MRSWNLPSWAGLCFFCLVSVCCVSLDAIETTDEFVRPPPRHRRVASLCVSLVPFYDPRGPDASDGRSRPRDAGYTQVRVDRRARRREALLLDDERRHQTALVAHDAGAQVPVDDEPADARDLLALEDDGDVALREDEEPA